MCHINISAVLPTFLGNIKVDFSLVWEQTACAELLLGTDQNPEKTHAKVSTDYLWYRMVERRFQHCFCCAYFWPFAPCLGWSVSLSYLGCVPMTWMRVHEPHC